MSNDVPKWIKHSSKIVHKNKWFKVQTDDVTRPNGKRADYNIVVSFPAVFIIPQDEDGNIYLIGQYRYAVGQYSMEIPAGSTDGEDPLHAAKRELKEETGFVAEKWEKLGEFYPANGILKEKNHVFRATGLKQTGEHQWEDEGINKLIKLPLKKVLQMIKEGEIKDGQTISSLMLFAQYANFLS